MSGALDAKRRATLRAFALTLIPDSPDGPSAAEAGVAETWIDVTLAERPDLLPGLIRLLDAYDGAETRPYLERMEREAAGDFARLTYAIAASFFRSPVAKEWLGVTRILDEYEGAAPEPTETTEQLLRPVREMGPRYRPTEFRPEEGSET